MQSKQSGFTIMGRAPSIRQSEKFVNALHGDPVRLLAPEGVRFVDDEGRPLTGRPPMDLHLEPERRPVARPLKRVCERAESGLLPGQILIESAHVPAEGDV